MQNDTIILDREAFLAHHTAIYAGHAWPPGAVIAVTSQKGGPNKDERGPLVTVGFAPVEAAEATWALIEPAATQGRNTWISVGGLDRSVTTRGGGRGKASDVVGLPALVADLDFYTPGTVHAAGDKNPSPGEVKAWVDAMPLLPTLAVHSGGGAHVWVATDFLLNPLGKNNPDGDPVHADLLARWKAMWISTAEAVDRNIDKSVLADPARILRPAGTPNANQGKLVRITRNNPVRYSLAELQTALPELPVKPGRPARVKAERPAREVIAVRDASRAGTESIGTRFSFELPAGALCEQLFHAKPAPGDGLTFPRDDGSFAPDANARVYPATANKPVKVTIFGQRVLDFFGLDGGNSLSSWDFIGRFVTFGDWKAAARLLKNTEVDGSWGEEFFQAAEKLIAAGPPAVADISSLPAVDAEGSPLSIRDAIERREVFETELENNLLVRIGHGPGHGLFERVWEKGEDGGPAVPFVRRVTSFIAWKKAMKTHMGVGTGGTPYEVSPPEYTVQIVNSDGRSMSREGFTATSAHDPKVVLDTLDIGAVLPPGLAGRRQVEAMLRATGRYNGMTEMSQFHTLGWMRDADSDRHVFLAPAGSVTADGPTETFVVAAPAGSQDGAGTPAALAVGYPVIPQSDAEIREAAAAIPAFYAVFPNRPDLASAMLGGVFASPLALSRRMTLFLVAQPGFGKTNAMNCAQAFISSVVSGKTFTGGAIAEDTIVAAAVKSAWFRGSLGFWDDYAMGSDVKVNDRVTQITKTIIKASYGQDGASGGTAEGGLRASRVAESMAFVTGEATPTGEGIVSRIVRVELAKGDVAMLPMGQSPYDRFISEFAPLALQLQGAYLQWLAARVDQHGLTSFTRENDRAKQAWNSAGEGRTAETVSVLGVGMMMFREFAEARGFADLLPAGIEVDKWLTSLIAGNVEAVAGSNPAATLIAKVRDTLGSKGGYLELVSGETPTRGVARMLGWRQRLDTFGGATRIEYIPGEFRVGYISNDLTTVLIINDAVARLKRAAGIEGVPVDQLKRSASGLVIASSTPGDRAPSAQFPTRPRGWLVSAASLDLDFETPVPAPTGPQESPVAEEPNSDDLTSVDWS